MTRGYIAAMMSVTALAGVSRVEAQDARARFLSDYELHALELRDAYTNVYGRFVRTDYSQNSKSSYIYEGKFKHNFRNFHLYGFGTTVRNGKREGVTPYRISVQNPRYGFTLKNQWDTDKWVMTEMKPAGVGGKSDLGQIARPYANFLPTGRSYLDLAKDANVKVVSYGDGVFRGQPVKRLTMDVVSEQVGKHELVPRRLSVSFRPDMRWVCVGCQSVEPTPNEKIIWEEIYNYNNNAGDWPIPTSFESRVYRDSPNPDGWRSGLLEFGNYVRSPTPFPDSDFMLTAFGYPEPENLPEPRAAAPSRPMMAGDDILAPPPDPPSRRPLWLALAGGGLVLVGVVFAVRRRRAAAT